MPDFDSEKEFEKLKLAILHPEEAKKQEEEKYYLQLHPLTTHYVNPRLTTLLQNTTTAWRPDHLTFEREL